MGKFYSTSAVARKLSINRDTVWSVAVAGGIRIRELPGQSVGYLAEDVDRIARESVRVATKDARPSAPPCRKKRAASMSDA